MNGYDQERRLPNNTGVPKGSGLYVWLTSEVTRLYGPELVQESQAHGDKRYLWLIEQLQERGNTELIAEFHRRRKADANERRQRDRKRHLAVMQQNLLEEEDASPQRRSSLEKEIEKYTKLVVQAEERRQ